MPKIIVLAFSGGLDTSFCIPYLTETYGASVHAVTVDCSGLTDADKKRLEQKALGLGATAFSCLDGTDELYRQILSYLIKGNVLRDRTYPLCVGAERYIQATFIAEYARQVRAASIAHGSTGAGNDQIRFDVVLQALLPDAEILTPIRDQGLSRDFTTRYLRERGFDVPPATTAYSINQGVWGTTIGGRETQTSEQALPWTAFPELKAPHEYADEPEEIEIHFTRGLPTAMNILNENRLSIQESPSLRLRRIFDQPSPRHDASSTQEGEEDNQKSKAFGYNTPTPESPLPLLRQLHDFGVRHGIGRGMHLGDTILGIKGRIGFEAPVATLLYTAHRELEKLVLSQWQRHFKDMLADSYGMLLHEGHYLDPVLRDIEAFFDASQEHVEGAVRLYACRGNLHPLGATSPYSLMNPIIARYGEESKGWTGAEARAFAKLWGLSSRLFYFRGQGTESREVQESESSEVDKGQSRSQGRAQAHKAQVP